MRNHVFDTLIGEEADDTGDGSYDQKQFYVVDVVPQVRQADVPFGQASQPMFVFSGSGDLTQRNLLAPNPAGVDAVMAQGAVASLGEADVVTCMIGDDEGSVREVVDNSGGVIDTINYNSFGLTAYESDPSVAHWAAFAGGHVSAATGLENEDERWRDLPNGGWLSQDPSGFSAGDTDLSRYVGNDPVNAIDPSGLKIKWTGGDPGQVDEAKKLWQEAKDRAAKQQMQNLVQLLNQIETSQIEMSVGAHQNGVFVGAADTHEIDISDVNKLKAAGPAVPAGAVMHEVIEQYLIQTGQVQNNPAGVKQAHIVGIGFESALNGYEFKGEKLVPKPKGGYTYTRTLSDKNGARVVLTVIVDEHDDITEVHQN